MKSPLIIGITGGSGSGKTLFLHKLVEALGEENVSVLSMDNYYKPIHEQSKDEKGIENFDLPESLDRQRFYVDLSKLKSGQDITIKEYTFNNSSRNPKTIHIKSCPVIVVEGIFTFCFEEILELLGLKLYVEAPEYLMLSRRIERDAKERGYDLSDVLYRFQHHVTPSYKKYIEPYKLEADLIIPNQNNFDYALAVVSSFLKKQVDQ
ncbi:uridine kinase [Marinoscillum sp. MHG1-6]|uniref:uridine kinase n=1 Tax=Marinoscillum sp. MHG1-6 TaxID=2959627 RepID=UPI0021570B30|nr:uridine kinase [Marinoscillum sp. MHG1-6]